MEKRRCHEYPGYEEKEAVFNISLKNWYCVDFENHTWGGNWDGNFVYFYQINVEQCINSTENNNTCSTQDVISNSFINPRSSGNLYYSQMTMSVQPSMNDFSLPLKPHLVNYYQMLNLELSKRKVQTFKLTSVYNDVGWFFQDIKINSVYSLDFAENDFTLKKKWEEPLVFSTYNYLGNKRDTYYRTYTKIQEVIAAVGGFAKFFYTCILITFFYVQKVYRDLIIINKIKFNTDSFVSGNNQKNNSFHSFNNLQSIVEISIVKKTQNEFKVNYAQYLC